ncbi:hypothetical protein DSECCO2_642630 [anaerobic digester metagenome]
MPLPDPRYLLIDRGNLGICLPGLVDMSRQAISRRPGLLRDGDHLEPGIEKGSLDLFTVLVCHHDDDHVAVHLIGKIFLVGDVDGHIVHDMPGKDGKPRIPAVEFQIQGDRSKRFQFSCALLVLLLPRLQLRACCDEVFYLLLDGGKIRLYHRPDLRCGELCSDFYVIRVYPARILDRSDLDERRSRIARPGKRVADRERFSGLALRHEVFDVIDVVTVELADDGLDLTLRGRDEQPAHLFRP